MKNSIIENWQAVPGYEGLYEASDLGRIRSLKFGKVKVLKPGLNMSQGYCRVVLCKDGKTKNFFVQRLVFSAFNGPIPPDMVVDHVNNVRTDNRLQNLQLLTRADNLRKAHKGKKCKPFTDEHRAKIRAAALARYQREKKLSGIMR